MTANIALVETLRNTLLATLGDEARKTCDEVECNPVQTAEFAHNGALSALRAWLDTPEVRKAFPDEVRATLGDALDAARTDWPRVETQLPRTVCLSGHPVRLVEHYGVPLHGPAIGTPLTARPVRAIVCTSGSSCRDWHQRLPAEAPVERQQACSNCANPTVYVVDRAIPTPNPDKVRLIGERGVTLLCDLVCPACDHVTTTPRSIL